MVILFTEHETPKYLANYNDAFDQTQPKPLKDTIIIGYTEWISYHILLSIF